MDQPACRVAGGSLNSECRCLKLVDTHRTAKGRKGTSRGYVLKQARSIEPEWAAERLLTGLSSGEGLISAARQKDSEAAVQGSRLLVLESELASVLQSLKRQGNTLSAVIREAWDTGNLQIATRNDPIHVTDAHISIIAHITRDELKRLITSTEMANGFANRFLWVCAKRSKLLPEGGNLDWESLTPLTNQLRDAVASAKTMAQIKRDESARALWHDVYEELSEGQPGLSGAATSRAEPQVMRLALIYALLDCSNLIRRAHLLAALALWKYCKDSADYIFAQSQGDSVADRILRELLTRDDGMSRTEIRDVFQRNRDKDDIDRALDALAKQGLVPKQAHNQWTNGRFTAVKLEA